MFQTSFELPVYTAQVDAVGTLNALEAVRQAGLAGKTKFYQVFISNLNNFRTRNPIFFCVGIHLRAVRQDPGAAAEREDALLPALPLRVRQADGLLVRRQLPRGVQYVRRQRHPLQPREPAARRDLRHAQDYAGGGGDQGGDAGEREPRQPQLDARLGPRARLRGVHVADAAAGRARGLCGGHGRDALGQGVLRACLRARGHAAHLEGRGHQRGAQAPLPIFSQGWRRRNLCGWGGLAAFVSEYTIGMFGAHLLCL